MEKIEAFSRRINISIGLVAGVVLCIMVFLLTAEGIGRTAFAHPIKGTLEITELMLGYIIFFSLTYALIVGIHVRVSLVLGRLPPTLQFAVETLTSIIGLFFFALLLWGSCKMVATSFILQEMVYGIVRIPLWTLKLAVPIGAFLMVFQFAIRLATGITQFSRARRQGEK